MPLETTELEQLTDEEVQARLAGTAVAGPKRFRGRELAPYTSGLRDLLYKVLRKDDTGAFLDALLVHILMVAYAPTDDLRLARRRELLAATDDVDGFRARVSLELVDTLTNDEMIEARRLVNEILQPSEIAQTAIVSSAGGKKKDAKVRPSRTAKSS